MKQKRAQKQFKRSTTNWFWHWYMSTSMKEEESFQEMTLEQLDIHRQKKKKKKRPSSKSHTSYRDKWILKLNVKCKTFKRKYQRKSSWPRLWEVIWSEFLEGIPKAQCINKNNTLKFQKIFYGKNSVTGWKKKKARDEEKIFVDHISNKALVSILHKKFFKLNSKEPIQFSEQLEQTLHLRGNIGGKCSHTKMYIISH